MPTVGLVTGKMENFRTGVFRGLYKHTKKVVVTNKKYVTSCALVIALH